jgi:OOP family OmpA-OmpF porin
MKGRSSALVLVMLLFATAVHAGTQAGQWQITPLVGYTTFKESETAPPTIRVNEFKNVPYYGGRFGYQFTRHLGLELGGGFMSTKVDTAGGPDVDVWHLAGDLILSAPLSDPVDVFLLGGAGRASAKPTGRDEQTNTTLEVGAGLRWFLSRNWGLRFEARNIVPTSGPDKAIHNAVAMGGGVTYAFGGKAQDADGDLVPDHKDKCPDTPAGATVDAAGCPADGDGDGIVNGIDQCADTPRGATVDARGCPTDADSDGVPDGIDQCASTPSGASVDARGCPVDGDGDGIPDGVDRCANTPTGALVGPDGCPRDTDADGVPDGLDKCPETIAGIRVDKDGCAMVKTEIQTELLDTGMIRISNINFDSGKSTIPEESFPILNDVGVILVKWPELEFEIGGHTDSRGSATSNQKLSEARATAVRDYLVGKHPALTTERFKIKGYGESKPVVKNTNAVNMSKNRRVEFVVLNKDVLKRSIETQK